MSQSSIHNFQENILPIYRCEISCHNLLYSAIYTNEKLALLTAPNKAILGEENPKTTEVLLYGRMNKIHTSSIYSEGY